MKNLFVGLFSLIGILFAIAYLLDRVDTRTVWFLDSDGDGHGDIAEFKKSDSAIEGYVDNADDCNDRHPDISPDAQGWHQAPYDTSEELTSFDYNCDGSQELEYTSPGQCAGQPGWYKGIIPSCGESGLWQTQCQGQQALTEVKVQRCR